MAQAPHAPPPGAIQALLAGQGPPVPAAPQQAVQQAAGQGPQAAGQGPQAAGQGLQAAQAPQAAGQGPQAVPQHAAAPPAPPPAPLQPVGQGQGAGAPIVQQGQGQQQIPPQQPPAAPQGAAAPQAPPGLPPQVQQAAGVQPDGAPPIPPQEELAQLVRSLQATVEGFQRGQVGMRAILRDIRSIVQRPDALFDAASAMQLVEDLAAAAKREGHRKADDYQAAAELFRMNRHDPNLKEALREMYATDAERKVGKRVGGILENLRNKGNQAVSSAPAHGLRQQSGQCGLMQQRWQPYVPQGFFSPPQPFSNAVPQQWLSNLPQIIPNLGLQSFPSQQWSPNLGQQGCSGQGQLWNSNPPQFGNSNQFQQASSRTRRCYGCGSNRHLIAKCPEKRGRMKKE
ncbi:atherin-like [Branchiostoma floridae]|uniref:Atherin-like n=1 Tax=Branchiostoma floridae TaxID=7739 RepID=A0A9J7HJK7_BRAFL|nr:atherin-like [Branchiostoma floridae]